MRCKACNSMIGVWRNTRTGMFEDLCSRCRAWVYYGIDSDFQKSDSCTATCTTEDLHDLGIDIDPEEDILMDRNHELPCELFDDYRRE